MKAEIEIDCKDPDVIVRSLKPDNEELKKFDASLKSDNGKIKIRIDASDIPGLLAGINSYLRLVKVASDAMEA
jgi:tRNA threonylcarbamoyladenosine modification (KEOPS) complex  Pcc1 subunit